ncbi:hypothetical protein LTR10_010468 [Elasticomyces elasticus]|uniref:Uracil permease n=1 Tax=Elasticomyces elasticus TaxID=574655 RepID=A0AAN7W4S3_9PEZI|nr:hypothetical protein LTR10_010468 [Elasticomyces elasticus]KAK4972367.1 hypothetical protein LTR42_006876 [Elasticomyces elasticus]KAK5697262.1 hypothetical protein LTR97_007398 [Elasticomyces elasticus]
MASYDYKGNGQYESSAEPVEVGQTTRLKKRFGFHLAVDQEPSSFAATPAASNADFDPVPPSNRTWGTWAFVAYWMADAWAVSNWEVASSMIAVGLSWKMAIGACVLGNTIMGLVITVNGRVGAILHTPFPVLARMPFGYYFSYFVVLSRCVLATVWLGVQTTTGGQCMTILLGATWPSFKQIANTIPEDEGITTQGMIGFLLYFLLQIPFLCIPYTKVQYFFGFKSIIAPIIFLAVFGSTLHKAGGTISHSTVITDGSKLHGSALAWAFFANLNGVLGNYATLGLNIADFARYSKKPSDQNVQAIVIPCIFSKFLPPMSIGERFVDSFAAIVGLLGIFTAAASQTAYGEVEWNPIVIVGYWSASGSSAGRAATAFGAIGLIIVTLGINISANSISAANDLVSFCPKYINIRRAAKFLAFLGGYTIFLGPMTSILMTDYYIVRRGRVSVPDMYNFHGMYRYSARWATNWRSVVALIIGFAPPLPGFIHNIESGIRVSSGGQNIFAIGYIYSFVSAGLFYWIFMKYFPHKESMLDHADTGEDIIAEADQKRRLGEA